MLSTKEIIIVFKNKFIELQNNLVEDEETKKIFNHIKIIESEREYVGAVILCKLNDTFLIIENYRYGINDTVFELPRGGAKSNETFEECAIRELKEETNITFDIQTDLIKQIGVISINSSILASKVPVYLIEINQIPENIELQSEEYINSYNWLSLKELNEMILNGKIIDSFTLSALKLYDLNK